MVGGATVICIGPKDRYITRHARAGISSSSQGAAIERPACSPSLSDRVAKRYGRRRPGGEEIFWQMSIVEDALTAMEAGVRKKGDHHARRDRVRVWAACSSRRASASA